MYQKNSRLIALHRKTAGLWQNLLSRLKGLNGTPQSIAAGFACGVAVTFTPFLGFHCILAVIIAWFIRSNVLAAAIGTVTGNPWTFPFIWISVLYTGRRILGDEYDPNAQVDFLHFFEKSTRALLSFDFSTFFTDIWPILQPMMIGCIPFFFLSWMVSYFLLKTALSKLENNQTNTERNKK